jgi:hypothetical protein
MKKEPRVIREKKALVKMNTKNVHTARHPLVKNKVGKLKVESNLNISKIK